ncbi:MAG: ribosome small subunit-dependent GTPase A [Bacteriovoracaceae bacterium]|nr:ribosome small subunit-dependent GTPase A [Bacteriovoracaceae bacterium]
MSEVLNAQVVRSSQRQFSCKLNSGEMIDATAKGNLLKGDSIVVGDKVEVSFIEGSKEYQIDKVCERESEIFRVSVREQKKKITAANCNLLVILSSVSKPAFKQGIVDRFLVRACQWGIRPIVIFNKCDQLEDLDLDFESKRLGPLGVESYEISALEAENYKPRFLKNGWLELQEILKGRTAIFLGQSGVGKSRTISALSGGTVDLRTHKVGKVGKGSHTTTWSELIQLPLFDLIDSPGIRSFSLEDINPDDLLALFPDLEEVAVHCKFNNCQHLENSKGCAFHKNDWDDAKRRRIFSRLESFTRIVEEVSQTPIWSKKL